MLNSMGINDDDLSESSFVDVKENFHSGDEPKAVYNLLTAEKYLQSYLIRLTKESSHLDVAERLTKTIQQLCTIRKEINQNCSFFKLAVQVSFDLSPLLNKRVNDRRHQFVKCLFSFPEAYYLPENQIIVYNICNSQYNSKFSLKHDLPIFHSSHKALEKITSKDCTNYWNHLFVKVRSDLIYSVAKEICTHLGLYEQLYEKHSLSLHRAEQFLQRVFPQTLYELFRYPKKLLELEAAGDFELVGKHCVCFQRIYIKHVTNV